MYLFLPLLLILIHQTAASVIINEILDYQEFKKLLVSRIFANQWIWVDFVIYYVFVIVFNLLEIYQENSRLLIRVSGMQSQLYHTQLKALESQIHPHFLFNTLNTLSTLILKNDNAESIRMLTLLKEFLHSTLQSYSIELISLEEELRFINHYLDIEKIRFKDKMFVELDINEDCYSALVPNFILQPIVENAVHHAIAKKTSNGIIKIASGREKENLMVSIEDNGPGITREKKSSKGIGLKITRERLSHHYGNKAELVVESVATGGLKVNLILPYSEKIIH